MGATIFLTCNLSFDFRVLLSRLPGPSQSSERLCNFMVLPMIFVLCKSDILSVKDDCIKYIIYKRVNNYTIYYDNS